ncbi:MAG: YciI family protein [Gaiellaceae bacterium]
MQFLVVGFDGKDDDAAARRENARPAHESLGDQLLASGDLWYAAEIENENGDVIGSMRLVDFDNEAGLQDWLTREPYITSDVWQSVHKHACRVRDPWQFSRPEEFFASR